MYEKIIHISQSNLKLSIVKPSTKNSASNDKFSSFTKELYFPYNMYRFN